MFIRLLNESCQVRKDERILEDARVIFRTTIYVFIILGCFRIQTAHVVNVVGFDGLARFLHCVGYLGFELLRNSIS